MLGFSSTNGSAGATRCRNGWNGLDMPAETVGGYNFLQFLFLQKIELDNILVVFTWESEEKVPFFLWFVYVLRSFSESQNDSCKEFHGVVGAISSLTLMFSRFWLMTAVWTVLVATIAANKSEACPTSATTRQSWVLGLKKKTFFSKTSFWLTEKTKQTTSYITSCFFFFVVPQTGRRRRPEEKIVFLEGQKK